MLKKVFTFLDHEAIPLCDFTWIHWLVCNIPANIDCLLENISVDNSLNVVQGQNSFASPYVGETDFILVHNKNRSYCNAVGPVATGGKGEYYTLLNNFYCSFIFLN
ncbi:hypothetical protein LL037_13495 [Clostridium estertheticum]|nr:hypothetical protein LL037_13495 [Clostridium estertheticum]